MELADDVNRNALMRRQIMPAEGDLMRPTTDQQRLVQQAARALGRSGLAHAYGHCSLRLDESRFLVCAAMPMGLIASEPGTVVPVEGNLPAGVLGEVRVSFAGGVVERMWTWLAQDGAGFPARIDSRPENQ